MQRYEIVNYITEEGHSPFQEWLDGLKDEHTRNRLYIRLRRAVLGNFGDWKAIKGVKGLCEMREHHGPGYRIFYTIAEQKMVILLAGATKKDQKKAIAKAKAYLDDYERRLKT